MTKCNSCPAEITWEGRPNNSGAPIEVATGQVHKCPNYKKPATQTTFPKGEPRAEVPIEQIVAEIEAIRGTMAMTHIPAPQEDSTAETLEAVITQTPLTESMIEGIWKYAISRKMSR